MALFEDTGSDKCGYELFVSVYSSSFFDVGFPCFCRIYYIGSFYIFSPVGDIFAYDAFCVMYRECTGYIFRP